MISQGSRSRRQFIGSAAGVIGAAALGALGARSTALRADSGSGSFERAAEARDQARRIPPSVDIAADQIMLPVDHARNGLVCLNNFGGFSAANGPCGHRGVDIGEGEDNTPGRPLLACVDGVIEKDDSLSNAGLVRVLRGDDGVFYRYHHLAGFIDELAAGDRVTQGDVIGFMGATGNTSWVHLHFEVWLDSLIPRDGTSIDAVPLIAFPESVELYEPRGCRS